MFFGLTNSLATFQTMMNDIFVDMISEGVVVVYLDDILIFTKDLDEHCRITQQVLGRLVEHRIVPLTMSPYRKWFHVTVHNTSSEKWEFSFASLCSFPFFCLLCTVSKQAKGLLWLL